ncbi:hypothetical protein MRB53_025287 [Persea americana]|uniref:Uncharacterized protein n=1 Tax=Persea americana TaxID=3435 RepID=A0ACC2LEU8_PERAE|nr:hypothetical protein MRB53_025287 [Persea americana]
MQTNQILVETKAFIQFPDSRGLLSPYFFVAFLLRSPYFFIVGPLRSPYFFIVFPLRSPYFFIAVLLRCPPSFASIEFTIRKSLKQTDTLKLMTYGTSSLSFFVALLRSPQSSLPYENP